MGKEYCIPRNFDSDFKEIPDNEMSYFKEEDFLLLIMITVL